MPLEHHHPPRRGGVQQVWGAELGSQFTAISAYFLINYSRAGLSATDFTFICQLFFHKWDERAPYPSLAKIAERMGVSHRYVRKVCASLESRGFVRRELSKTGGSSRYHLDGLISKFEAMKLEDDAKEVAHAG